MCVPPILNLDPAQLILCGTMRDESLSTRAARKGEAETLDTPLLCVALEPSPFCGLTAIDGARMPMERLARLCIVCLSCGRGLGCELGAEK